MTTANETPTQTRTLLGLRPPAELDEGIMTDDAKTPARPAYGQVSSGYDSEEAEGTRDGSDLAAALRALAIVVVVIGAAAMLIR